MSIHESLVSTEDSSINIETSADVIKPVFAYGSKLVDETKLHVTNSGLEYTAVDPANVAMVELNAPAECFDAYNVEETVLGLNLSEVMGSLRAGRKRAGDEITLSVTGDRLSSTVQRDYDGTEMDLRNNVRLIDPDSIRQEPDIPELDMPKSAAVPRMLFQDVAEQVYEFSDHIRFASDGDALVIDDNHDATTAVVKDALEATDEDVSSTFSLDYIKDEVKAFKAIGADELTVKFGQESPVRFEFTTELNGAEVTGSWFQAPRIQSE